MIYKIFSVRDRSADAYGRPTFALATGSAIRSFGDEINRPGEQNTWYQHPEDFDLYELGFFDDASGEFQTHKPKQVAIGKDLATKK